MSTYEIKKGPRTSKSQKIGDIAASVLHANKSDAWSLSPLGGDDFGYDFQVYAFEPESDQAQCVFNIQLKGTTQEVHRINDGEFISYPFDVTTLTLWNRSKFATVVAIADLIDTQDQKEAKIYYKFISEELDKLLKDIDENSKTVNIRVPTGQEIHKSLDILPEILPYLDEIERLKREEQNRRSAQGTATRAGANILEDAPSGNFGSTENVSLVDLNIDSIIEVSPAKNILQPALDALRIGDVDRVLEICSYALEEHSLSDLDLALVFHMQGLSLDEIGSSEAANDMFERALEISPDCDPILGHQLDRELANAPDGDAGKEHRVKLLKKAEKHIGLSVTLTKAKILAINGEYGVAREILKIFPEEETILTKVLISLLENDWSRVIREVESSSRISGLRPKHRLNLSIFKARALFHQGIENVQSLGEEVIVIPPSGLKGIDYDKLENAFESSKEAMLSGQRLNWPSSVGIVLDIFISSSILLDRADRAKDLLYSLGVAKAKIISIRKLVIKALVQQNEPDLAIEIHRISGESIADFEEKALLITAYCQADLPEKAISIADASFLENFTNTETYLSSLIYLAIASNNCLNFELLDAILNRLDRDHDSKVAKAILESILTAEDEPLRRQEALLGLFDFWEKNNHPSSVSHHLFYNLNPTGEKEAQKVISIATYLEEEEGGLGKEEYLRYSHALIFLNQADVACQKLRIAAKRFPNDPKILAQLGIALEINGHSGEAFEIFENLLSAGKMTNNIRNYFVDISTRMGLFDTAETHLRAAYSNASDKGLKLSLLNNLFNVLLSSGKKPKELLRIVNQFGELADPEVEQEEGYFLQMILISTAREDIEVEDRIVEEMRSRLDAFNKKFPRSRYVYKADLPRSDDPNEFLTELHNAIGLTQEIIDEAREVERKLDSGELHVPFSWRPKKFLRDIPDCFALWELRKQAPLHQSSLHFNSYAKNIERKSPDNFVSKEILISLTSLLLLEELDLLPLVLDSFPSIVISRETMTMLHVAMNPFLGGWGRQKAQNILEALLDQFSKIRHPVVTQSNEESNVPQWFHEEKLTLGSKNIIYFSDDIVETILTCRIDESSELVDSICTPDFLVWAEKSEMMSPNAVADKLSQMIRLKIGILVPMRYFLAAIPDELNRSTSEAQSLAIIEHADTLNTVVEAVWNPGKPFADLLEHFCGNVAYLMQEGGASQEVLIYMWQAWFRAVRYQMEPEIGPFRKFILAFCKLLVMLDSNQNNITRLWSSCWTSLRRIFGEAIQEPEDRFLVSLVADALGRLRASVDASEVAIQLSEKARVGLQDGTELEELYSHKYIQSMVEEEYTKKRRK